jgi:hypothetical protein
MIIFMWNFFIAIYDIFLSNPIAQILWLIWFLVSIYNFWFCKNKKFIFFTMIASIFWWFHFLFLWLLSAAYINIVDVAKNALALKYAKNKYLTLWFILLYIIISYFTYTSIISLIPLATAILSTILVFYIRWIYLNIWFLFVIALWMIYNFLWHSIWWLSTDITLMTTWIFWVVKTLYKDKKEKKKIVKKEKEILESIN